MPDLRGEFLKEIEMTIVNFTDKSHLENIMYNITMILNNYEIMERCTEIVPSQNENMKILSRYLASMAVEGKSEKTIAQYKRTLIKLDETICKPYTEYGTYDIRYFLACEKQRGLSNTTLENTRAYISSFFRWMVREEILNKNITEAILPIKTPKEVKEPFSDIEIDALRSACHNLRERALIEVLLATGIRVDELSKMDINDINFATMTVHVRYGKGSKERITYISNVAKKHLEEYLKNRDDGNVSLFVNYRKERLNNGGIRSILKTVGNRAKVGNVHPHRFRRTFATGLAARGMDIQEIQKLLGHSNLNTTMRYIKINDAQVQASYRRFIA